MPIKNLLDGYPFYSGSKKLIVCDYKGPASYTTGGETLTAREFGQGGIDFIEPMNKQQADMPTGDASTTAPAILAMSFSGTYYVTIKVAATAHGAVSSVTIMWYVTATGAEVVAAVDLSDEEIRFMGLFT